MQHLCWVIFQPRRLNDARSYRVDPNVVLAPFYRQGFGEVVDSCSGSARMRHARHTPINVDNDVEDDALFLRDKKSLSHRLGHVPGTIEVVIDDGIPAFFGHVFGEGGKLPSGVVDQDVQSTGCFFDKSDKLADLFRVADVTDLISALAQLTEAFLGFFEFFFFTASDEYPGARLEQLFGNGVSNSTPAARNQSYLLFKYIGLKHEFQKFKVEKFRVEK